MSDYDSFISNKTARINALADWFSGLSVPPEGLILELGCGHGHYLAAYAAEHPHAFCLGVDLLSRRIALARNKARKRGLANLAFLKADAAELFTAMPGTIRVRKFFILFPDPWPKRRQSKRRLLQHSLLDAMAAHAAPGAQLHFRTDHEAHFTWTTGQLEAHPLWQIADAAAWPFAAPTWFQERMARWQSLTAVRVAASAPGSPRPASGRGEQAKQDQLRG